MSVQQLTQPIVNSIAAFDATKDKEISFVVIGGAQVVANRIVITNNQTGVQVYDNTTITMKLSHLIPANTLENGQYYNIVVYTIDSSNNQSVPSVAVPFYCFSQPVLTIDNIPASQTIENGTYKFQGNYLQQQGENLDSYQYTLYDSNKNVLTSSGVIYYQTDNSLSYTFVGMSNDTAYYVELSGQTVNNTNITTGLLYFTVRYNQPSSFAICDLVNDCENGYIQISSNIVAIDGVSNPDPPIYIDDKEVDLTDPDAWVQWNKGFNIQNDFTMRVWGRKFTPYEEIINLTNDLNTESSPNKIVLKWMIGDYVKELPEYQLITGKNINIENGYKTDITDLNLRAENLQEVKEEFDYGEGNSFSIDTFENQPLSMKVLGNQQQNIVDGEEGIIVEETGLINITDVDDTKESSIFIKGNSYQETRDGSNLFNIEDYSSVNGITIKDVNSTSITLEAQLASDYQYEETMYFINVNLELGKTYTIKAKMDILSGNTFSNTGQIELYIGGGWKQVLLSGSTSSYDKSATFTIDETGNYRIRLKLANAGLVTEKFSVKFSDFMIYEGTEEKPYQPYGVMPSPEYPSNIETVGSNVNLFDKDNANILLNTFLNPSDGKVGFAVNTKTLYIECKPNTTYTVSKIASKRFGIAFTDIVPNINVPIYNAIESVTGAISLTQISTQTSKYLCVYYYKSDIDTVTEQEILDSIKIEKGTKATPYSPYNMGSVEIDVGNKNWFSFEKAEKLATYAMPSYEVIDNNSIELKNSNNWAYIQYQYSLNKNTQYTISFDMEFESNENITQWWLTIEDTQGNIVTNYVTLSNNKYIKTFTTREDNIVKIKFFASTTIKPTLTKIKNIQIELGEKATEKIEHQSQTKILPIQEEMLEDDYIDDVEYHTWGKVVLTGNEDNWQWNSNNFAFISVSDVANNPTTQILVKSNYFLGIEVGSNGTNYVDKDNVVFSWFSGTLICIKSTQNFSNVEETKAFLQEKYNSGNPVVIYYKLATPKILPLTEEQENIIGQLSSSPLYSDVNNIFTNDNLSIVNVHYNYTISSPSPNLPAEIITVGSNINLINLEDVSETIKNGIAYSITNGIIKLNGTATQNFNLYLESPFEIQSGNYTLSNNFQGTYSGVVGHYLFAYPSNSIVFNGDKIDSVNKTKLLEQNNVRYGLYFASGAILNNVILKPKLEVGTKATSYSLYNKGSVEINLKNKNLFDLKDKYEVASDYSVDDDDFISLSYDNSSGTRIIYKNYYTYPSKYIKTDTKYYLVAEIKEVSGVGRIVFTSDAGAQIANVTDGYFSNFSPGQIIVKEITTKKIFEENINIFLRTFIQFNAGWSGSIKFRISVLENQPDINTFQYDKYMSQSLILPIQEEMLEDDYISDVEYHTWGKIILDGNEAWAKGTKTTVNRYYVSNLISSSTNKTDIINKCNYLNCISQNDSDASKLGLSNYNGVGFMVNFALDDSNFLTLDQFKSWLQEKYNSGNPVIVYYKLKTPKSLSLIEEQESVMSELRPFYCYEDITYISTDNDVNLFNIISEYKPSLNNPSEIYPLGDIKNLINIEDFNITYNQQYSFDKNIGFELIPGYIYTLSFNFNVNSASTDLYYCIGYGKDSYENDINADIQYVNQSNGRNYTTFVVPELDEGNTLWIKFAKNLILADVNVDISSVQLELGKILTDYQSNTTYNIYPTICEKNLFNFDKIFYLKSNNLNINTLNNGYSLTQTAPNSELSLGFRNILNPGDNYSISFVSTNDVELRMFAVNKNNQIRIEEIEINNGNFVAPENYFDIQIVFNINVGNNSNVEIYNIQIEKGSEITEYENYVGNSSQIILENPLSGVGDYKDLMCLESLNLLNPSNQTAIVEGSKTYYLSQNTTESLTLSFINEDNNVISTIDLANGTIETPDNCVKIKINKTQDEIETQQIQIVLGNTQLTYYPFVEVPSIIRLTKKIILNGTENWSLTDTNTFYLATITDYATSNNIPMSNYFKGHSNIGSSATITNLDNVVAFGISHDYYRFYIRCKNFSTVKDWKAFLQEKYNSGNPVVVYYVLANPEVEELSEENVQAMQLLKTYEGISNFYTDNKALGLAQFNYISGYSQQQTDNAYVSLKCWNGNVMPYFVHSNYIDIPKDTDKIFIWLRRKNNIFDLQIENLGNYSEGGSGEQGQPQVSITESSSTTNSITVTAQSIDTVELKTVRFSRNNGESWEEIITVDGLSSTDSHTFTGLSSGTEYTIRVEAININDVIGGISQIITTE